MKFLLIAPFLLVYITSFAQVSKDTSLFRIETLDGNEYIGKIVSEDTEIIILKTDHLGAITIRKVAIKRMTPVNKKQLVNGVYWFDNPQSTRYFWQPNGYGLKAGEGYYQNVWILFNQVAVGVTDNISIGAGMVPLFLFAGVSTPVWLTPKLSIPIKKDKFNMGVGALLGTVLGESGSDFGIAYGTATLGDRNTNMSIGLGYGYLDGDWANSPIISFSAMIRTGQRGYLMTENYYIGTGDEDVLILFLGGRRLIKNSGIDFGLMIPATTGGGFFAIPWLGLTIPFGSPVNFQHNAQKK